MILIVENYLSECTCASIREAYDDGSRVGRFSPRGSDRTDVQLSSVWPGTSDLLSKMLNLLYQHFKFPTLTLDYCAYTRVTVGGSHELHADSVRLDGSPNHTPTRVVTVMVYLSDGRRDFSGGVLHLPELGVEVQARPGLLVAFPTDLAHRHEVTVVTDGVRDSIATWFR